MRFGLVEAVVGLVALLTPLDLISSSSVDVGNEVCSDKDTNCDTTNSQKNGVTSWKPFYISGESKWISFNSLVDKYAKWHDEILRNEDIPCREKKVLVFSPNAGLGDSIGALTTGFLYALKSGRMFFMDWKPFAWSLMFRDLPFFYDYQKALNLKSKSGEQLICPSKTDETSFLNGHITLQHPLTKEENEFDFHTDYSLLTEYFLKPSEEVQKIIDKVAQGPFKNPNEKETLLHKVAIVMRTGIGEYNQFLSSGDEANFVTCFRNYARKFFEEQRRIHSDSKKIKFAVFVTSDDSRTKQNAIDDLKRDEPDDWDVEVVTLEDSAIHVMHMSSEESNEAEVRTKLWKTIAEFFLIGQCEARFLTHGSLFGKAAAERGGGPEETTFLLSDSNCDGERKKYSYLKCHKPKYPPVCGLS